MILKTINYYRLKNLFDIDNIDIVKTKKNLTNTYTDLFKYIRKQEAKT